jgi:hypothetical protein
MYPIAFVHKIAKVTVLVLATRATLLKAVFHLVVPTLPTAPTSQRSTVPAFEILSLTPAHPLLVDSTNALKMRPSPLEAALKQRPLLTSRVPSKSSTARLPPVVPPLVLLGPVGVLKTALLVHCAPSPVLLALATVVVLVTVPELVLVSKAALVTFVEMQVKPRPKVAVVLAIVRLPPASGLLGLPVLIVMGIAPELVILPSRPLVLVVDLLPVYRAPKPLGPLVIAPVWLAALPHRVLLSIAPANQPNFLAIVPQVHPPGHALSSEPQLKMVGQRKIAILQLCLVLVVCQTLLPPLVTVTPIPTLLLISTLLKELVQVFLLIARQLLLPLSLAPPPTLSLVQNCVSMLPIVMTVMPVRLTSATKDLMVLVSINADMKM